MIKNLKLKDIETKVSDNEYISNIKDIIGEVKDIVLKTTILDIKKIEFQDGIIVILKLKDNSGIIPAVLVSNRDKKAKEFINNLSINKKYLVKGNILNFNSPLDVDLKFIFDKFKGIINIGDNYLVTRCMQEVD